MIKRLTLLVVMLLASIPVMVSLPNQVFAETVDTAWVRRYNGPVNLDDYPAAIAVDGSGNAYVTGYSKGSGTDWDYATIKYYSDGDTAWVRRYNGPGNSGDAANAIAVDDSNYVYVTGSSGGIGTQADYSTIKYYPNGDIAWVERYNGPGNSDDVALAMAVDDSNYVYVTGSSKVSETDWDYATIKYSPDGDTAWVRRYNGPGNSYDNASAIAADDSGYVYVTGYSQGSGTLYDYATIKYTPDGDTAWLRRYNGPGNSDDYPKAIAVDGSRNVYVSGNSYDNETDNDYTVIKYHPNGDTAWVRRYNGLGNSTDNANAMVLDHSDNVYVTGTSATGDENTDYATVKYNSDGDSLWVRLYDGPVNGEDGARAIAVDDSNNVYVTGESDGSGTYQDYATIKYKPNGDSAWVKRYNSPANESDVALAIAVDDSGNVYVTGQSYGGSGTGMDYCTIKYSPKSTDVKDETESREKPSEFGLSQNYPNPFNPTTVIRYTVRGSLFVVRSPIPTTLKIYNALGEIVRTLVNEEKLPGDYTIQWDGKNDDGKEVASGVYFYQLRVGDFSEPKKMVLLK